MPYCRPCYGAAELDGMADAIRSGWWSRGPKVAAFEQAFAERVGARHALALNSCTAGLFLGLKLYDLQPGDQVITTPLTFCATANVIVHNGATPVFADVDPVTGLIDPAQIEQKITPKTKGVLPVHYAGRACDMDAINALADKHGLFVLEDAAHAVYTTYANGNWVGNTRNTVAFSFYATKNLAVGEGGMLTTNNAALFERAQRLSLHGMSRDAWKRFSAAGSWRYDVVEAGYKYNMTDPAAALGLAQLDRLETMQQRRLAIANAYNAAFADLPGITPLPSGPFGRNAWHLYMLLVDPARCGFTRDQLIEQLHDVYRVGTSVHYMPVHLHPFYRQTFGTRPGDCPHAEALFAQMVSLPLYPSMTEEDVTYVCEAVRAVAARFAA